MNTLAAGSKISDNTAIVIDAESTGGRVFAILPDNKVTPWAIWRQHDADTGDCFAGTYFFTFTEASAAWVMSA